MSLPVEAFDAAVSEQRRVDHRSRVSIRQNHYSVPARYVARRLTVRFTATTVTIHDGGRSSPPTSGRSAATSRSCP